MGKGHTGRCAAERIAARVSYKRYTPTHSDLCLLASTSHNGPIASPSATTTARRGRKNRRTSPRTSTSSQIDTHASPTRTEIRQTPLRVSLSLSLAHTGPPNHPAAAAGPTPIAARWPEIQRQVASAFFCLLLPFSFLPKRRASY